MNLLISPIANEHHISLIQTKDGHSLKIGCWYGTVDELPGKLQERITSGAITAAECAEYEALIPFLRLRAEKMKPLKSEKELRREALLKELAELENEKTYLTTEQFIKVLRSLDKKTLKVLDSARSSARTSAWDSAWTSHRWTSHRWTSHRWISEWASAWDSARSSAWGSAWDSAWDLFRGADLAILAKNSITPEEFETLTKPLTDNGISLYAEDWDHVLEDKK